MLNEDMTELARFRSPNYALGFPVVRVFGTDNRRELVITTTSLRRGWRIDEAPGGVYVVSNRDKRVLVIHAPALKSGFPVLVSYSHPDDMMTLHECEGRLTSSDHEEVAHLINEIIAGAMSYLAEMAELKA